MIENSINMSVENTQRQINNQTQKKKHNRKFEWINNVKKELQRLEEGPEADLDQDSLWGTIKKLQNIRPWQKIHVSPQQTGSAIE